MWILFEGNLFAFGVVFRIQPKKNSFSRALFGTEFLAIKPIYQLIHQTKEHLLNFLCLNLIFFFFIEKKKFNLI
jgi:hypothetical protein